MYYTCVSTDRSLAFISLSWLDTYMSALGGGTLYNGLYGEAPPERGIFFRLQLYEREGILLTEVYKRVGKSVIWVC